jgi:hypothetical protein
MTMQEQSVSTTPLSSSTVSPAVRVAPVQLTPEYTSFLAAREARRTN